MPYPPHPYDPYSAMGMDPICMLAYQAGVEGQGRSKNLEEQIEDLKEEKNTLKEILDKLQDNLKDEILQEKIRCYKDPNNIDTPEFCQSSSSIGRSSVAQQVKNHVKGKSEVQDCSNAPGATRVSFYFNKEHAVMYAQLPFLLLAPASASAEGINIAQNGQMGRQRKETIPSSSGTGGPAPAPIDSVVPPAEDGDDSGDVNGEEEEDSDDENGGDDSNTSNIVRQPNSRTCDTCPQNSDSLPNGCKFTCPNDKNCPLGGWERGGDTDCLMMSCPSRDLSGSEVECTDKPEVALVVTSNGGFDWCGSVDGENKNCRCVYKRYFEEDGEIDENFCSDPVLIRRSSDEGENEEIQEECEDILEQMSDVGEKYREVIKEQKELEREERTQNRLKRKCEFAQGRLDRGRISELPDECQSDAETEAGGFCTDCFNKVVESFYPKPSAWDKILSAATPLIGTGMALYGINKSNRLRARQGYSVDNSAAIGLAYPFAASMLYGGALTGGRRSLACSPTANHNPYGSFFGNILGQMGMGPGLFHGNAHFNAYTHLGLPGQNFPGAFPGAGNFNAYANLGLPGQNFPGMFPGAGNFNAYAHLGLPGQNFPGAFPGAGNFNAYAHLGLPGQNFPGAFPGAGNFNAYANLGLPGQNFPGMFPNAGFSSANAAYLEMYQKQQAIQMEYQQMIFERTRSKQRSLSRLHEEMRRLQLQAYDIQYGSGGFVNFGASHIGSGTHSGSSHPSGDGSGH